MNLTYNVEERKCEFAGVTYTQLEFKKKDTIICNGWKWHLRMLLSIKENVNMIFAELKC